MEFPEPWYPEHNSEFVNELRRETGVGHPLHGVPILVLARRRDRDDFLFAIEDGSRRVAKVHLTWARHPEKPPWPQTVIFADIATWSEAMRADHTE